MNHQRLMARLAQRVGSHALLKLNGKMLKAKVVMPDGVVASTDEGVLHGGPLSPLHVDGAVTCGDPDPAKAA